MPSEPTPPPSRAARLDAGLGRLYGGCITAFLVTGSLVCFGVFFLAVRTPGGVERWVGSGLILLMAFVFAAVAWRTRRPRGLSEWMDNA